MKVLFAHDHIFYRKNNSLYSNGGLSFSALKRYTDVFKNLVVISRQKKIDSIDKSLTLSSGKNIDFVEILDIYSHKNILKHRKIFKSIEKEVKEADYVISRLPSVIGNIATFYARKYKKPYMLELAGCPFDAYWHHSIKGKILAPYKYLVTRTLVKNANYVLYVTNNFLQNRYPTEGKKCSCSNVMLEKFDNITINNRIKKITKLNNEITIGTIGSLEVRYKGQEYIIKALGDLKKRGVTNYKYQLLGRGNPKRLLSIAEDNNVLEQIEIIGSKPSSEVYKWLDQLDIYTQPSQTEGLPRGLIESMSRGLPAFGSDAGGIPELLEKKVVYRDDKNKVENIINILLKFDKNLLKEQALRNYEESQKYDKEIIEAKRYSFLKDFREN